MIINFLLGILVVVAMGMFLMAMIAIASYIWGIVPAPIHPLEKLEDVMYRYDTFMFNKVTMIPGDILHLTVHGTKLDYEPDRCWSPDRALKIKSNMGEFWMISDGKRIAPMDVVSGENWGGGGGPK